MRNDILEKYTYNKETGDFINRKTFMPIKRKIKGYIAFRINNKTIYAHRAAFYLIHNFWPDMIDHINQDRSDNRIINLQATTKTENAKNTKINNLNTSGQMGVHFSKPNNNWIARITVNGKRIALGSFSLKEDAIQARKKAEIFYEYSKNHGSLK